jgi:hypothetical protein
MPTAAGRFGATGLATLQAQLQLAADSRWALGNMRAINGHACADATAAAAVEQVAAGAAAYTASAAEQMHLCLHPCNHHMAQCLVAPPPVSWVCCPGRLSPCTGTWGSGTLQGTAQSSAHMAARWARATTGGR